MNDLFWLTSSQFYRMRPYLTLAHSVPRVDDCRVISGTIHVIRNGLRWCDASAQYGLHKTLYNRFVKWIGLGAFDCIFSGLAGRSCEPDMIMIHSQ